MNKKICFIETCNSSPHLETTLELAKKHLDAGDKVYYHFIGSKVLFNDFPKPPEKILFFKSSPESLGLSLIQNGSLDHDLGANYKTLYSIAIPKFKSLKELMGYEYKTYKAGLACASSLISRLRMSDPLPSNHEHLIRRILISGISTYEYTLAQLKQEKPDLVYLFNGRFANNRAILEAAIEAQVPYRIHERGSNKTKYIVSEKVIHDPEFIQGKMLQFWENKENEIQKKESAKSFFVNQRNGIEVGWRPFTLSQKKGSGFNQELKGRKLVVYFSSSNDEYDAVGDFINWGKWESQQNAVESLIRIVKKNPNIFLAIRLHPHMKIKHREEVKKWLEITLPTNALLILPEDPTDTYTLIEQAAIVVTCGSTVGIEAVYWGVPSICLGPNVYSKLDAVYLPKDEDELQKLLLSDDLVADAEKALPYGYYASSYGIDFKHYDPITLFSGKFMGVNLQEDHLVKKIRTKYRAIRNQISPKRLLDCLKCLTH